jgi:hypothetical protein
MRRKTWEAHVVEPGQGLWTGVSLTKPNDFVIVGSQLVTATTDAIGRDVQVYIPVETIKFLYDHYAVGMLSRRDG